MSVKAAGLVLAVLIVALGAYGLWMQRQYPRVVVSTGSARVESATRPETAQTLKTRVVEVGRVRLTEVELPNGTWIDCGGDCRKAALEAGPEFFESLARTRGR